MSHPAFVLLASALLAGAFAAMDDRTSRERRYVAARVFLSGVVSVVAGAWLVHWVHG